MRVLAFHLDPARATDLPSTSAGLGPSGLEHALGTAAVEHLFAVPAAMPALLSHAERVDVVLLCDAGSCALDTWEDWLRGQAQILALRGRPMALVTARTGAEELERLAELPDLELLCWPLHKRVLRERLAALRPDPMARLPGLEELRRSEAHLNEAQNLAAIGSWHWDMDSGQMSWSRQLFALGGFEPMPTPPPLADVLGRVHPQDHPAFLRSLKLARLGQSVEQLRLRLLTSHGPRHLLVQGRPLRDPQGRVTRVFGTAQDITAQFEAERRLIEREERFRALVSNLPAVVYRCKLDQHWTMFYISDMIEAFTGYPSSDFVPSPDLSEPSLGERTFASVIHPEDRRYVESVVQECVDRRQPYLIEYRLLHADGSVRWVNERGQAMYQDQGGVTHLDGVIFDVTDIKRMQTDLRLHSQLAAVGTLAAGVAHEINNPLAIIIANLEYIREELLRMREHTADQPDFGSVLDDAGRMVSKIGMGAERVRRIVRDLRTFADAAEQSLERVDVARALEFALHLTHQQTEPKARLRLQIESMPSVWANEAGLVQVFVNLLRNAAQAIPEGNPEAHEIAVYLGPNAEGHAMVEISDTGRGMTRDVLAHIFAPFFTTRPVGEGSGLGLFICQGIVQGIGGVIDVETRPGLGSSFRVIFPPQPKDAWQRRETPRPQTLIWRPE